MGRAVQHDRFRGTPQYREPWIVERRPGEARWDPTTGHWRSLTIARRYDMAIVRSLRTGRHRRIAVRVLQAHDDAGLYHTFPTYPDLPAIKYRIDRLHIVQQYTRTQLEEDDTCSST